MNSNKVIGNTHITFSHKDEEITLTDINDEDDSITFSMDDWHDIRLEIDKECGEYL